MLKTENASPNTSVSRHSPGGDEVYECSDVNDCDEAESVALKGERA